MNLLVSEGHKAARINTQGQWDEAKGIWRKSGSTRGVSDVLACLWPWGRMLAVEVKFGEDTTSPEQDDWLEGVKSCGGLSFIAKTYQEFENYYFKEVKPFLYASRDENKQLAEG